MTNRMNVLAGLVDFKKPLKEISGELSELDWDYEGEPLVVTGAQVSKVLERCSSGEIDISELEGWANLIECREDLAFERERVNELENIIYRLSNPALEGEISTEVCKQLVDTLS